jgi:hypothetical protein
MPRLSDAADATLLVWVDIQWSIKQIGAVTIALTKTKYEME